MRLLLITDEEWNDIVYGNNVLTNWFKGYDAEFAQIYCSPGLPHNTICEQYFQITDKDMVKSLFSRKRAGREIQQIHNQKDMDSHHVTTNAQRQGIYKVMKNLSLHFHGIVMVVRDFIWMAGHYDKKSLSKFVEEFAPDIIFCPRMATPKMLRLEKIVHQISNSPIVAFTADNEASLEMYSWSPIAWLRRLALRRMFKRHVGIYRHYCMFSPDQAANYHEEYGLSTSCLYKCGDFSMEYTQKEVGHPIRMVYAGRLYGNRWKTLSAVGDALRIINKDGEKMTLDIYTQEKLTYEQRKMLGEDRHIYQRGSVTPDELREVYRKADIALHVESFEKKYRLATKYSFSTKIIDLMASSCAILAICWNEHTGLKYLKEKDAAFCIDNPDKIIETLQNITDNNSLIHKYARKAYECGMKYHSREIIHSQLNMLFSK